MSDETPYISFPGIESIREGSFALVQGTTPSAATITFYPQANPPALTGKMVIAQGATFVEFYDCLLDMATLTIDGNGQYIAATILDRRWRWKYPKISGCYNVYLDSEFIDATTEKTPRELATLCLQALNERAFDVSQMPNDSRPTVDWDYTTAREALEQLCEITGCRVSLGIDNIVRIVRVGEGGQLPDTADISSGGFTINPHDAPQQIAAVTAPKEWQWDFQLEACGVDVGNIVKPVDDLSYKPEGGWNLADLDADLNAIDDTELRELARTVYTIYRVKWPAGGMQSITALLGQESGQILYKWQIELLGRQVITKSENGVDVFLEPVVYGQFADGRDSFENNIAEPIAPVSIDMTETNAKRAVYQGGFAVDAENMAVKFSDPMFTYKEVSDVIEYRAAVLFLRIGFHFRKLEDRALDRFQFIKRLGATSTTASQPAAGEPLTEFIRDDNLRVTEYWNPGNAFTEGADGLFYPAGGSVSNVQTVKPLAEQLVANVMAEYQQLNPQTLTYDRIRAINLDGAIQQVSWRVGGGSVGQTIAYRNNQRLNRVLSYRERRRRQIADEIAKTFRVLAKVTTTKRRV